MEGNMEQWDDRTGRFPTSKKTYPGQKELGANRVATGTLGSRDPGNK